MLEKVFSRFGYSKDEPVAKVETVEPSASYSPIITTIFDGEKTFGEIGIIKEYLKDHYALSARSWESMTTNDITQNVIKKYVRWVCGGGLKLQSEPVKELLSNLDVEQFSQDVESRFKMFLKSKRSSWSGEQSIDTMISECITNAKVGGDCLVILRVVDKNIKIQIVDTMHLVNPPFAKADVRNGIKIGYNGQIIEFYIRKEDNPFEFETVKARDSRGRQMAFLVYGLKLRTDDVRGIPVCTAVLESLKMLDRYKSATVGSAEERQKIAWFIERTKDSDESSPLQKQVANQFGGLRPENNTYSEEIRATQGQIMATSQKTAIDMPAETTIKSLSSDNELSFTEFFMTNLTIICSCVGIPPEIALSKYDSNFSASRAAIKDWEHTLNVERKSIGEQFLQPIYDLWLDLQLLSGKLEYPQFQKAILNNDFEILDALRNARWTGASVPHIDPLKEVQAERLKLGTLSAHIPLTTVEKATENVNGGESISNMEQFKKEMLIVPAPVEPASQPMEQNQSDKNKQKVKQ